MTDVTDICWGTVRNGSTWDLALEFYPDQPYDVTFLQKNNRIGSNIVTKKNIAFYDNNPFWFTHNYTYNGYYYTKSAFNWVIQLRNAGEEVGKIPVMYYYFSYAGVKNSSSTKWITFNLDGVLYRYELGEKCTSDLTKTQYGELAQDFIFFIDASGYSFLEQLAKARKVVVTLEGDNFMLSFDLPGQAKNKILEGKKQYEKVCGLVDGPLAFARFNGTPLTVQ